VYRLKAAHPRLPVIINGGIPGIEAALEHLKHVDGVMLGRAAYQEPWRLLAVDPEIFGAPAPHATMKQAIEALYPYIERERARGVKLHALTRHLHGAFHAVPGARAFRRHLATQATKPDASVAVLAEALALVLDRPSDLAHTAAA
jgi:tRNA-dihydrouridine synthase A